MTWDLSGNIRGPAGAVPSVVNLASDQAASTTLANVTGMSAVVAIGTYRVDAAINFVVSAGTSPTMAYGFTGPATSLVSLTTDIQLADAGTCTMGILRALALQNISGAITVSANSKAAVLSGYITFTAAGTLQLQQRLAGTAPVGSTKANSKLILEKVA